MPSGVGRWRVTPGAPGVDLPAVNYLLHCRGARNQVIKQSDVFSKWLRKLRDRKARAKILARIDRLRTGNPGDVKPAGSGISELRIDHGPGYRVYFQQRGEKLALLLCGGDKKTQDADIKRAIKIANDWKE
jgi:putative addiction module killer protein